MNGSTRYVTYILWHATQPQKLMNLQQHGCKPEIIILVSTSERKRQISYALIYIWSLIYAKNEPLNKIETDSQTYRRHLWLLKGQGRRRGMEWEFGIVQLPSHVWLFMIPWTAACLASLSPTIFWSYPKFISSMGLAHANYY